MTTVQVYHNQTSRFSPYSKGDQLTHVATYSTRKDAPKVFGDLLAIGEEAFELFNIGYELHLPDDQRIVVEQYFDQHRSLSVGDVVQIGEAFLSVDRFGFSGAVVYASQIAAPVR